MSKKNNLIQLIDIIKLRNTEPTLNSFAILSQDKIRSSDFVEIYRMEAHKINFSDLC